MKNERTSLTLPMAIMRIACGLVVSLAAWAIGCVDPVQPEEEAQIGEVASADVALDWTGSWSCNEIVPETKVTTTLMAGQEPQLLSLAAQGQNEIRLLGGPFTLEQPLIVADDTKIVGLGAVPIVIHVSQNEFPDGEPMILVQGSQRVWIENLDLHPHEASDPTLPVVSADAGVHVLESNHVRVQTVLARHILGSSYQVEASECVHFADVYAAEVDHAEGCLPLSDRGYGMLITSSNRVWVDGSEFHALQHGAVLARNSSDLAIFRSEIYDVAPNCGGLGVIVGAKLQPSVTTAGFNLWVEHVANGFGYSDVRGSGFYVDASAAGSQTVLLGNSQLDVLPNKDGICLRNNGTGNTVGSDIYGNRVFEGDILTDVTPIPGAGTNLCSPSVCSFGSSCIAPAYWW